MTIRYAKDGEVKCMMILKDGTKFEVPIERDDGWFPGGAEWDECHPEDGPSCWNHGGDK